MADELTWVIKNGENGTERTGTLFANGVPIDLTNKTVTMNVRVKPTLRKILSDIPITPDSDQSANTGRITWLVLAAHTDPETIPAKRDGYLIEFKLVEQSVIDYVPRREELSKTYGLLIVQENLD